MNPTSMQEMLFQLGVAGIILLVIREMISFFKLVFDKVKPNAKSNGNGHKEAQTQLKDLHSMVSDLHHWHSIEDSEGVKIWYVRRSLEQAITKLADNVATQTRILENLYRDMQEIKETKHE